MTLTLNTHSFIDFISCLHLLTFRSQTAIVSKISIVFSFTHVKDHAQQGHHWSKLHWAGVPSATLQVSWRSAHQFWRISIVFAFYYIKAFVSKIDLAVKYVKVILGSSFEQTMMAWSPKCYIPSLVKIALQVLEKIFHIWAWWPS